MSTIQGQQRTTFKRIIDGRTLNFALSPNLSLTQIMSKDPTSYNPNFASTNMIIKPILTVSGAGGDNQVVKACSWWIDGTSITGTNTTYGATVGTTSPFALTINKNLAKATMLIRCDYEYTSPVTGLITVVTSTITITRVENAGTTIIATIDPLDGNIYQTSGGSAQNLRFKARMIRGGSDDDTNVSYAWEIMGTDGNFYAISSASAPTGSGLTGTSLFSGFNTQTLTVSSDAIINVGTLRCTIKDTDSESTTYNKTAVAYMTVLDATDPYVISIDQPQGDGMSDNNTTGLKMMISVMQGGKFWTADQYNGKTLSFYRETDAQAKDSTFAPSASDFSGWSIGTGDDANEVMRTFSSANGTDANRTVTIKPSHLRSGVITTFLAQLSF